MCRERRGREGGRGGGEEEEGGRRRRRGSRGLYSCSGEAGQLGEGVGGGFLPSHVKRGSPDTTGNTKA